MTDWMLVVQLTALALILGGLGLMVFSHPPAWRVGSALVAAQLCVQVPSILKRVMPGLVTDNAELVGVGVGSVFLGLAAWFWFRDKPFAPDPRGSGRIRSRELAPVAGAAAIGLLAMAFVANLLLPPQPVSYIPQVMFVGFGLVLSVMAIQLWRRDTGELE